MSIKQPQDAERGNSLTNEFYSDAWAKQWRDMKRFSPVGRHTRRWISMLLKKTGKFESVLDIGCGDGSLLEELRHENENISLYGTDFSSESVEICLKRIPDGEFRRHDILDSGNPFPRVMDVGICSEVIEHVEDDVAAVKNIASWCRYLILTVPGGVLTDTAKEMGHLRHYSENSLISVVENAGLEVQYVRSWGFPLAYPWYARMRDEAGYQAVTGEYGALKKIVATFLYYSFFMNDMFKGGNKIFLLARNPGIDK